jgi:hypothetical protein
MSRGGAYAEGSITFALAGLARPPFDERARQPPRQDEQCRCLFKATDHTPSRTPFIGLMLNLAAEPRWLGLLVFHVRAITSAPFQAPQTGSPLPREDLPRRPIRPCLDAPRGSPRPCRKDASHRLLQPTSNTSTQTIARLSSPQLAPQRPPPHSASGGLAPNACGSAASDHLAAIRPRVG